MHMHKYVTCKVNGDIVSSIWIIWPHKKHSVIKPLLTVEPPVFFAGGGGGGWNDPRDCLDSISLSEVGLDQAEPGSG